MILFPIRKFVFAAIFVSSTSMAGGQSSSMADVDKVMIVDFTDGPITDCRTSKVGAPGRSETIERLFTRLRFDNCLWTSKVDLTDRSSPVSLVRVGTDLSCTLEEVEMKSMPEPGEESLLAHLRSRGLDDVNLVSSTETDRFLGKLRHQVVHGRMPRKFDPARPVYEIRAWIWSGLDRMSTFICVGPEKVMEADAEAIITITDSLQFGGIPADSAAKPAAKDAPASR